MASFEVGTFNLLNLVLPGKPFYPNDVPYTEAEHEAKLDGIAWQLGRMDADVVGFQEVWHETALKEACARSGPYEPANVIAPGADGSAAKVGLASKRPLAGGVTSVAAFRAGVDREADGVRLPVRDFSRLVFRADVTVRDGPALTATVCVAHLKSKSLLFAPGGDRLDPREEALGAARSLARRASEAAALRFLLVEELTGTRNPVFVLGGLNDGLYAVSNDIVAGVRPSRFYPGRRDGREALWDRLLYNAIELQAALSPREVGYTYIHNGRYEDTDHILFSERSATSGSRSASGGSRTCVFSMTTSLTNS